LQTDDEETAKREWCMKEEQAQNLLKSGREPSGRRKRPSQLLGPGSSSALPLFGRERERRLLEFWWKEPAGFDLRLIIGPGGSGKTRFAVEFIENIRKQGYFAGFVEGLDAVKKIPSLFQYRKPTLLVIDYAETKDSLVKAILVRIAEREATDPKIRLLLLARDLGEWWEDVYSECASPLQATVKHPATIVVLEPLAERIETRKELFEKTLRHFSRILNKEMPATPLINLSDDHFALPLFVQMAALAVLEGKVISGAGDLLDETLDHEDRYWCGSIDRQPGDIDIAKQLAPKFMALVTLLGGANEEKCLALAEQYFPKSQKPAYRALIGGLLDLYSDALTRNIPPLQPDVLGEHLVATVLEKKGSEELFDVAFSEDNSDGWNQGLTVLTRLAQREADAVKWLQQAMTGRFVRLVDEAITVAVETGDPLGLVLGEAAKEADSATAERLLDRIDDDFQETTVLRELATEVSAKTLEAKKKQWPEPNEEQLAELARIASNLSARYSSLGFRDKALSAAQEAVDILRVLASTNPNAFRPYLATFLNNLAKVLSELGRRKDALSAAQEAVDIYRKLASVQPDVFRSKLATLLNNVATFSYELGHSEDALSAAQEAVDIYRELVSIYPDKFHPDLGMCLNNLATFLSDLGCLEEALSAAQEAVDLYRYLASTRPDAFLPNLAMSLNNVANRLSSLDRREEALAVAQESVKINRDLVSNRPEAFLPALALSLNNVATFLSELGRREEALSTVHEAVVLRRKLALLSPDAFLPDLALSLGAFGSAQRQAGRHHDAKKLFEEGLKAITPFLKRYPQAFATLAGNLAKDYSRSSKEAGEEPDMAILGPVIEVLEKLKKDGE
jgi:tetratricopeptide (TPR) repeat protein